MSKSKAPNPMETMLRGAGTDRVLTAAERRAQRQREREAVQDEGEQDACADEGVAPARDDTDRNADDRVLKWVDPGLISIWEHHDRVYSRLREEDCADILATLSDGQRVPALIRPARDSSGYPYELVSGARRHWAASHLGLPLLVEVDETVDDRRAFEINQIDNLARHDVAPIERARTLEWASSLYTSLHEMARAIGLDRKLIRNYLRLAEVPPSILTAYGSELNVPVSHGRVLGEALSTPGAQSRMESEARAIQEKAERTRRQPKPSGVLKALLAAAHDDSGRSQSGEADWSFEHDGITVIKAARRGNNQFRVDVRLDTDAPREEVEDWLREMLSEVYPGS